MKKRNVRRKMSNRSSKEKKEGNSHITSKRLTIPPGFLRLGIKSETVRRTTSKEKKTKELDLILKEDLHGLFNKYLSVNSRIPRRSARITQQKITQDLDDLSASEYYKNFVDGNSDNIKTEKTTKRKEKSILKNRSKSLFREINEKYQARAASQNNTNFEHLVQEYSPIGNLNRIEVFKINSKFCENLDKQLCIGLRQKSLVNCKSRILNNIIIINNILYGKMELNSNMTENGRKVDENMNIEENLKEVKFEYVPKSQWVYETPPRQKIILPKVEGCSMLPAVICSVKKQSNIYEIKPNTLVDLTNYTNRQNIQYDERYMEHVGTFEHMDIDSGFKGTGSYPIYNSNTFMENKNGMASNRCFQNSPKCYDTEFNFVKPTSATKNHFSNLTTRPKKTTKRELRSDQADILNRKLHKLRKSEEVTLEANSNYIKTDKHFQQDFTLLDSGMIHRVNSQGYTQISDFKFEFKKNLFENYDDEMMFSFKGDSSNVFDFNDLKDWELNKN